MVVILGHKETCVIQGRKEICNKGHRTYLESYRSCIIVKFAKSGILYEERKTNKMQQLDVYY